MAQFLGTHFGTYRVGRDAAGAPELHALPDDPAPSRLGHGLLELARHPTRVSGPMVREGWWRGTSAGEARGCEPFLPVSWDAVLDRLALTLEDVRTRHGNAAIFAGSYGWASAGRFHHAQSQLKRALTLLGGFTSSENTYSYGTAGVLLPHVLGPAFRDACDTAPFWDAMIGHCRLLVAFGGFREGNAAVEAGGSIRHGVRENLERLAAAGCRIIVLSPSASDRPPWLKAEHWPIRPGSDAAVLLAMARVLRCEGLADTAFLARCTAGYDAFAEYLDSPHAPTPEHAAALSGIPAGKITMLARALAATPSALTLAWSLQRARFGEQPYWAAIALAAMTGQIGRPGCGVAFGLGSVASVGNPVPRLRGPALPQGLNPVKDVIPVARITDLLARPGGTIAYNGRTITLPHIRMVWWAGGNPFHHHQDLGALARAWQQPATIVVQDPFWTATARRADVVLPAALPQERNDIAASSRDHAMVASRKIADPPPGVLTDHETLARLMDRFGLRERFTEGRDEMGWIAHLYAGYRAAHPELPDFSTFWDSGIALLPGQAPDTDPRHGLARFVADPAGAPLATPSGRIELYSACIAGFGHDDCPGHPVWREPEEWCGAPLARDFPLHLLSPQPEGRLHSQLDAAQASRAGKRQGREQITLSPADGATRGIASGDAVRVFNRRGALLAIATLDPGLMPGVAVLPTGAWLDLDGGGMDVHGNPNILTPDLASSSLSQGPAPNSCLVEVERWTAPLPLQSVHVPPPILANPETDR